MATANKKTKQQIEPMSTFQPQTTIGVLN